MAVVLTSPQNEITKHSNLEALCKNMTPKETQSEACKNGKGKTKTTSDGTKKSRSQFKKQIAASRSVQNDSTTKPKDTGQFGLPKQPKDGAGVEAVVQEIQETPNIQNGESQYSNQQSQGVVPSLELHPAEAVPLSQRKCHSETDLPNIASHNDHELIAYDSSNAIPNQYTFFGDKDMRISLLEASELPENHLLMYPAGRRNDLGNFAAWYPALRLSSTSSHLKGQKLMEKSRSLPVSQRDTVYDRLQSLGRHRNFEFYHHPDETGRYIEEYRALHTVGRVGQKNRPVPVLGVDVPDPYTNLSKKGSTTSVVESWQHRLQEEKQLQQQRQQQQLQQQPQKEQPSPTGVSGPSSKQTESRNFPILAAIRERSNNLQVKGQGAKGKSDKVQNADTKGRELQQTVFLPPIENGELRVSLVGSKNNTPNSSSRENNVCAENANVGNSKNCFDTDKEIDTDVGKNKSDTEDSSNVREESIDTHNDDYNSNSSNTDGGSVEMEGSNNTTYNDKHNEPSSAPSDPNMKKKDAELQERVWRNYIVDDHHKNKHNFSEDYRTALLSYRNSDGDSLGSNHSSTKDTNTAGCHKFEVPGTKSTTSPNCVGLDESPTANTGNALSTNDSDTASPTNGNTTTSNPKKRHLLSRDKDYSRLIIEITNPPKNDGEEVGETSLETDSELSETSGVAARGQPHKINGQYLKSHGQSIAPNCSYHLDQDNHYRNLPEKDKMQNNQDHHQTQTWRIAGEYYQYQKVDSKVKAKRLKSKVKENHSMVIDTNLELRGVEYRSGDNNDRPYSDSIESREQDGPRVRSVNSDNQAVESRFTDHPIINDENCLERCEVNHKRNRNKKSEEISVLPVKKDSKQGNQWPLGFQRRKILRHSFNGHMTARGDNFMEKPKEPCTESQSLHQSYPLLDWKNMVDNGDCGFIVRSFPTEKCGSSNHEKDEDTQDDLESNADSDSENKEEDEQIIGDVEDSSESMPSRNISRCLKRNVELEVQGCLTIHGTSKLKDHVVPYPVFPPVNAHRPQSESDDLVVGDDSAPTENMNNNTIPQVTLKMENILSKNIQIKGKLLGNNESAFNSNNAFKFKPRRKLEPTLLKIGRPSSLDRSVFETTETSLNLKDEIARQFHSRRPTSLDRSMPRLNSSPPPEKTQHILCPDVYKIERGSNKQSPRSVSPRNSLEKTFMGEVKVKRELQIYAHVRKGTCCERQAEVIQHTVDKGKMKKSKGVMGSQKSFYRGNDEPS